MTTTAAYDTDERVKPHGDGFAVTKDTDTFYVLPGRAGWVLSSHPDLTTATRIQANAIVPWVTAEALIAAVIGTNQTSGE